VFKPLDLEGPLPAFLIHRNNPPAARHPADPAEPEPLLKPGHEFGLSGTRSKKKSIVLAAVEG
jgi:hypothetical protein